jgi:hypothetical protein
MLAHAQVHSSAIFVRIGGGEIRLFDVSDLSGWSSYVEPGYNLRCPDATAGCPDVSTNRPTTSRKRAATNHRRDQARRTPCIAGLLARLDGPAWALDVLAQRAPPVLSSGGREAAVYGVKYPVPQRSA